MTYTTQMKHALTMYDNLPLDKTFETLYAHTDENGVLYVPMASRDSDDRVMLCKMNRTERDVDALSREFGGLYKNLRLLRPLSGPADLCTSLSNPSSE